MKSIDIRKYSQIEALQHLETLYRQHPAVIDIAVFVDRLGQLVTLVVSEEADEDCLRFALDAIALARLLRPVRIVNLVALPADDPLRPVMFPTIGSPCRVLIWEFLVGSIETLTSDGARFCPTCHQPVRPPNLGYESSPRPRPRPRDDAHSCRGDSDEQHE